MMTSIGPREARVRAGVEGSPAGESWDAAGHYESLTLHHEILPRFIAYLTPSRSIVVG